jgi:hypothetical protein
MKQSDVLVGIADRATRARLYKPTSLNLSLVEREIEAFDAVLSKLREEFPFLCSYKEEMEDSELEQFDGLFAWLTEQLRTFPNDAKNPEQSLTNILALAALLECDAQLWDELAKAVPNVPELLIITLTKIIKENRANGQEILVGARYSDNEIQVLLADIASTNWTFKFWTLYHSARQDAIGSESYPMEWEILLSEAAKVPSEWVRWLAVLNEYPGRYPQLQEALGNTLASASGEALDAYVSSISGVSDFGRTEIATALTVFREKATAAHDRQRLWTAAFERWKKWDFGCTEHSRSLFRVEKSPLDFPVIGYLTECLDSKARAKWIAELQVRALAIERNWHSDVTSVMTERFKIISTYQLIAHSEIVAAGEPKWPWESPLYKPMWENGTLYRSLKYDGTLGPPTFYSD